MLKGCEIPRRYRDRIADDRSLNEIWVRARATAAEMLGTGTLLAIVSPVYGNGKTQCGCDLLGMAVDQGFSGLYTTAPDMLLNIRRSFERSEAISEAAIIHTLTHPQVLVIDELQERSGAEWENVRLRHLLDTRYRELKDTILIGNLSPDDLTAYVGEKVMSRIEQTGGVLRFGWDGFRRQLRRIDHGQNATTTHDDHTPGG
jgi:hypothetical protein